MKETGNQKKIDRKIAGKHQEWKNRQQDFFGFLRVNPKEF